MKKSILISLLLILFLAVFSCSDDEYEVFDTPRIVENVTAYVPYGGYASVCIRSDSRSATYEVQYLIPDAYYWADTNFDYAKTEDNNVYIYAPVNNMVFYTTSMADYKIRVRQSNTDKLASNWAESAAFGFISPLTYISNNEPVTFTYTGLENNFFSNPAFDESNELGIEVGSENNSSSFLFTPNTEDTNSEGTVAYTLSFEMSDSSSGADYDGCVVSASITADYLFYYYEGGSYLFMENLELTDGSFSVAGCNNSDMNTTGSSTLRDNVNDNLSDYGLIYDIIGFNFEENINFAGTYALSPVPVSMVQAVFNEVFIIMWDSDINPSPKFSVSDINNCKHNLE